MLTLSAIISGQYCTCIWQFYIVLLESRVTLLARGGNDIGKDYIQAKHTYTCIYIYVYRSIKAQISMLKDEKRFIYVFFYISTFICIWMHVYMDAYSYIYLYMQHLGAWEVCRIRSQCTHTQEAGECYTKLTQLWCRTIQILCRRL